MAEYIRREGVNKYEKYYDVLPEKYRREVEKIEKKKKGKSLFQKLTSFLTTGETGGAAYAMLEGKNPVLQYGQDISSSLTGTGYDNKTYRDVLEKVGMERTYLSEKMPWLFNETGKGWKLKEKGFIDPTDTGALGLTLDILGDPKTYMAGLGVFQRIGKGLKGLTKAGKKVVEETIEKGHKELIERGISETSDKGIDILNKYGEEIGYALKKDPNKFFKGITFMGQEILPRKYAVMPGRYADKLMSHIPIVNKVYTGTKHGIQDVFKLGADVLRKGNTIGDVAEETSERYLKSKMGMYKNISNLQRELGDSLFADYKKLKKLVSKSDKEAALDYVRNTIEKANGANLGIEIDKIGVDFLDDLAKRFNKMTAKLYKDEKAAREALGKNMYEALSGYMTHTPSKWGLKARESMNKNLIKRSSYKHMVAHSDKGRTLFKFTDAKGNVKMGTDVYNNLTKVKPIKGMALDLTKGQYETINGIKKALKKWGYTLEFKPGDRVHKTALGYFDPTAKKIVIASKRPTFNDIMGVIEHEVVHNVHFQYSGLLDMIETFSTKKGTRWYKAKTILDTAKKNAREEWEGILKANGVDFDKLTPHYKKYYREPTELLAFTASAFHENPKLIKELAPKTLESINAMKKQFGFLDINKLVKEGSEPITGKFIDKHGTLWKAERHMRIDEINDMMKGYMKEASEILKDPSIANRPYLETNPFEILMKRGKESANTVARYNFYTDITEQMGRRGQVNIKHIRDADGKIVKTVRKIDAFTDESTGIKYIDPKIDELPVGTLLPDFIVEDMKKSIKYVNGDELPGKILKFYDKVLGEWKGYVYGWYPGSHGRNLIGGSWNNFLANPKWIKFSGHTKPLIQAKDGKVTLNGIEYSYDVIRKQYHKAGILGQTGHLDVNELTKHVNPTKYQTLKNIPISAMETVENNLRLPLFLAEVDSGKTFKQAAETVFKYHFDYAPEALTSIERNFMRRAIPFYKWNRENIPLMMEEFIAQPGKMTGVFKMMRDATDDKGELMQEFLPDWLEREHAIIRGGERMTGFGLPPLELLKFFDEPLGTLTSGLTPVAKIPVEVATNYNTFKNKQISEDVGGEFARNYPAIIKNWLEWEDASFTKDKKDISYSKVNPLHKYWLYALPTGRLASILSAMNDEKTANKLLYALSNIKTYKVDMENLKQISEYRYNKDIKEILMSAGMITYYGKPTKKAKELLR